MSGIAITVGLNRVDPFSYDGIWDGAPLAGAELDADMFAGLASKAGLRTIELRGVAATRARVVAALTAAATAIQPGELLAFFYAGHGGFIPKDPQDTDEEGQNDETLCLFDGMLLDNELRCVWAMVDPAARVFSCADSCHSGSLQSFRIQSWLRGLVGHRENIVRRATDKVLDATYKRHIEFYQNLQQSTAECREIRASVIHIGACHDDQLAEEYRDPPGGKFSKRLRYVITSRMSYATGYDWLLNNSPRNQKATWRTRGRVNPEFESRQILS